MVIAVVHTLTLQSSPQPWAGMNKKRLQCQIYQKKKCIKTCKIRLDDGLVSGRLRANCLKVQAKTEQLFSNGCCVNLRSN